MAAQKKSGGTAATGEMPIESLFHSETRRDIPRRAQGELAADEEDKPEAMLYPRDPTLDPQLVWRGKDEQDRQDLAVPIVPIYIQEKIEPKALIEDLRARAAGKKPQIDLFGALSARRDIEEQIAFYQHEGQWTNRMILGDSLVVMTSLAHQGGQKGRVQMIYMDPPYGIKFGSNWQVSTRRREVKDGKIEDLIRQPEQIKAFRDTWELGVHSYLTYMRDRLLVARELLGESGSVFVQIGDENVHLVRSLLDEVFGASNFRSLITVKKTAGLGTAGLCSVADYILWYAKDRALLKERTIYSEQSFVDDPNYVWALRDTGERRRLTEDELLKRRIEPGWALFRHQIFLAAGRTPSCIYPIEYRNETFHPTAGRSWSTNPRGAERLIRAGRVVKHGNTLNYVRLASDFPYNPLSNIWDDGASGVGMDKIYVVQTNMKIVQRCMLMATDPGDLVLDPTCGSGTTAAVAEQWGRRWITIDTSRVAVALARVRMMSARYPYYLLSDRDVRQGFSCKRAPHLTLGSIANNDEIDSIHARHQDKLDPLRDKLNELLKMRWEEWEIPHEATAAWTAEARAAHAEWWQIRRALQKEIDASIARRAESEILHDQPHEDPRRVRVSGPFTVESLSPHRMLDAGLPRPRSAAKEQSTFVAIILENLKKAGIQNTRKNERLVLDRLNTFAGKWIQAEGEYTDKSGAARRVAISIGPEHGTVSPELVRCAAREALKGFDLVLVCGFAFDPLANEAAAEFAPRNGSEPRLPEKGAAAPTAITVLLSRMNPDLAMGDELLKKTGAGNLFMVFGEPDIALQKTKDGKITVEIKGLDVYDPTTGEVRGHTTVDIACWFLDTDYDGESFFVRHAYFTGANDPYEKLKRALKAEIDEATWSLLHTTRSRPFDPPEGGAIAIKVINHYGDEVLRVYKAP